VSSSTWRKWFSVLQNRLYLYPSPEPLPHTRRFWLALGVITIAVLLFSGYFILYLTTRHDALLTNAEDFGIMDQAIWNTTHGNMLHQTICNVIGDTNCYSPNGISRFAIHFEPILFPISLLYLIWSDPKLLLIVQTLVVASGAYPAFWLARLRLRNEWAGVAIAMLYLLLPAQQQATVFDFHAVTFTASLLLFTLYFMYTRRTLWLFVFAILSMACKEEIPAVIVMFGLWSMLFQRRWRSGLSLTLLGTAWLAFAYFVIFPHFSPTGHPLLASRYDGLGKGPVQVVTAIVGHPWQFLHTYVLETDHRHYITRLLASTGFLPILAPWVLVLSLPSLALNLLSSDRQAYTGLFHYNAEIVPVLIFSMIEGIVVIVWLAQVIAQRHRMPGTEAEQGKAMYPPHHRVWFPDRIVYTGLMVVMLGFAFTNTLWIDYSYYGQMPFSQGFAWPTASAHTALAQRFIAMIPPTASVSAQTKLVPHLSHRASIYLFPYGDDTAEYILLDVTGDVYPFFGPTKYLDEVQHVMASGHYGILAAQEGYVLLKRGLPPSKMLPSAMGLLPPVGWTST